MKNKIIVVTITLITLLISFFVGHEYYENNYHSFSNAKSIEPTNINLNKESLVLKPGDSETLIATIEPSNIADQSLIWMSGNKNIATVSANGKVTAKSVGETTITAMTVNTKIAVCKVIVTNNVSDITSITLNKTKVEMAIGQKEKITYTVMPNNVKNTIVTWASSNTSIATVSGGVIKAKKEGAVTITAEAPNGVKAKCKVTVKKEILATKISLDKTKITLDEGKTAKIKVLFTPSNATNTKITWSSDKPSVAAVDENGKVMALKKGTATITAKTSNNKKATCKVTVEIGVSKISLNKKEDTLIVGSYTNLKATITPSNATNQTITWSSDNPTVATVDKKGKITGLKKGTAIITAKANNGKSKTCTITVINVEKPITKQAQKPGSVLKAEYYSDTLKYWIEKYNDNYYAHVWVKDPVNQGITSLPSLGNFYSFDSIINYEMNTYGYTNKGMVMVNASFTANSIPSCYMFMSHGKIKVDINDPIGINYGTSGIKSNGDLAMWTWDSSSLESRQKVKEKMLLDDAKNTVCVTGEAIQRDGTVPGLPGDRRDNTNRTILCQVNKNNFILFSGSGDVPIIGKRLKEEFNCTYAINYDGGGSRKLYYKTNSNTPVVLFAGDRTRPDMFSFVEK